ncbi:MAG: DUF1801 domain-containing protein [Bacteroidota bacterium]
MTAIKPNNIDEYIAGFPKDVQKKLNQIRASIKKAAPEALETISYSIPAFKFNGRALVYFAGYKNHIGLYPVPTQNAEFNKDFAAYKTSGKGAIQFSLEQPIPLDLITKIVTFRLQENSTFEKNKSRKKNLPVKRA